MRVFGFVCVCLVLYVYVVSYACIRYCMRAASYPGSSQGRKDRGAQGFLGRSQGAKSLAENEFKVVNRDRNVENGRYFDFEGLFGGIYAC